MLIKLIALHLGHLISKTVKTPLASKRPHDLQLINSINFFLAKAQYFDSLAESCARWLGLLWQVRLSEIGSLLTQWVVPSSTIYKTPTSLEIGVFLWAIKKPTKK